MERKVLKSWIKSRDDNKIVAWWDAPKTLL